MNIEDFVKIHGRSISHLRSQKKLDRLGLVFGAGISKDFGFPTWVDLIDRIASNPKVEGKSLLDNVGSNTSISQLLFQNFRSKEYSHYGSDYVAYDKFRSHVQSGWHRVIHDALYQDVPTETLKLKEIDSYLHEYLDIIRDIKLTVNYNFDNTIQRLLSITRTEQQKKKIRGYRTVWNSDIQLYPQKGVIYHPNGFLPDKITERTSEDLIFLDDSFGDQLIESTSGHYSTLSYYYSQNTCLFIGLSLEDSTLKHLLRKCANMHPGHVHYYVYYVEDPSSISEEDKRAIIDANFEVYNLVTLFLNKEGIKNLAKVTKFSDEDYEEVCDLVASKTTYKYFLTGSVSVGKSTAVSNFRSLQTHDEWLENRIEGMEKDPTLISKKDLIKKIDKWVVDQWRKKNFNLARAGNHGIHIIDRCPLDAFAFTKPEEWIKKAKYTREGVTPKDSTTKLVNGAIILLIGDSEAMAVRALKLQKTVTPSDLEYRQELLKIVYSQDVQGIVWLDTREKSAKKVAKEISRIIHVEQYNECDIQSRLTEIEKGTISATTGN